MEAQFLGINDGKIHLHKMNGVKIAVPIAKMSVEDLEYVERITGESLDEDKPLSDIRRRSVRQERQEADKPKPRGSSEPSRAGASVEQRKEHDWFDFFLKAGVDPSQCERYSQNFNKDNIDESVLQDITPETLRTLGLKEGDILRVMRHLDQMFGRTGAKSKLRNVSFGGEEVIGDGEGEANGTGGLFSGPGGALRNNTSRKPRPAPAVQTSDVVDPKAFEQKDTSKPSEGKETAEGEKTVKQGFDDDAWEVKPPKQATTTTTTTTSAPATTSTAATSSADKSQTTLTGAMAELSLLTPPLQPTPAQPTTTSQPAPGQPAPAPATQPPQTQPLQPQPTGASPSFFAQLGQPGQQPGLVPQQTGFQQQQQQQQMMPPRQRPQPPQNVSQSSLIPPPPQRPLSAPQGLPQQSAFAAPPLQPQLTGIPQSAPPIAPPGQSLNELSQQRFQQQQQQQFSMQPLQPQPTGFAPQGQFQNGLMPQPTGFGQQPQQQFGFQQQPGFQPLAPQPTGFGGFPQQQLQPTTTGVGINAVLPPPLQPQPTGVNGFGSNNFTTSAPPAPPVSQPTTMAPLQPQKTGPPPVRFGVKTEPAKKLTPQPTGLRANLAQASKWTAAFACSSCLLCGFLLTLQTSSFQPLWLQQLAC